MFPYILLIKCSRIWIINVTETNNVAANMISYCSRLPSVLLYLSMRRICFSWVCFSCSCAFPVCLCVCVFEQVVLKHSSMRNRCFALKLHFILYWFRRNVTGFIRYLLDGKWHRRQTIPFLLSRRRQYYVLLWTLWLLLLLLLFLFLLLVMGPTQMWCFLLSFEITLISNFVSLYFLEFCRRECRCRRCCCCFALNILLWIVARFTWWY